MQGISSLPSTYMPIKKVIIIHGFRAASHPSFHKALLDGIKVYITNVMRWCLDNPKS
jgi:hypothetical protein